MDFDFVDDFNEDKIKKFLQSKLEAIQLQNKDLEDVLDQCKAALKDSNDESSMDHINIKISNPWKKICEGKYALGYTLEANSNIFQQLGNIILKWDSTHPFIYKISAFLKGNHNERHSDFECKLMESVYKNISGEIVLLITFTIPEFIDKTEYKISGTLSCQIDNKVIDILIPPMSISATDFGSHKLQDWIVKKLDFDSLLTIMSCSNKIELVMVLPEAWDSDINSTFEIHCSLTKVEQEFHCQDIFVSYKVSQIFDNSLVAVHNSNSNIYFVNIYTNSNDKLLAFVHYLHSCIPNVSLFPKIYYQNYVSRNTNFSNELLQNFRKSLFKEIDFVQDNNLKLHQDCTKTSTFRKTLCDMERETDELYTRICNMNY